MKKILVTLLFCISVNISAQEIEIPQYVNHMSDNPFMTSPAYAGIGAGFQFRLNGVAQWVGVKNSPNTQSITAEMRITDYFGSGLTIFRDSNGFTNQIGARLSLASHLILSDFHDSFLSFALSASYTQFSVDTNDFISKTLEALPNISLGTTNFDVSMLYRYERFAISANAANILNKEVKRLDSGEPEVLRKYSLYTLYTFKVNRKLEFEPSLFTEYFESDGRSENDVNVKLRRKIRDGYVWGGLSYTFLNDQFGAPISIAPLVGLKKNKMYFSYGLSINTNELAKFNYGTHMITLGFDYDPRPSLARCTKDMMIF